MCDLEYKDENIYILQRRMYNLDNENITFVL